MRKVGMGVNATKNLDEQLDVVKAENEALKAENSVLKAENEALKEEKPAKK